VGSTKRQSARRLFPCLNFSHRASHRRPLRSYAPMELPTARPRPIHQNWYEDVVWPHRSFCGFGWCYHEYHRNTPNGERGWDPRGMTGRSWTHPASGIMLPHWAVVVFFGSLAILPWMPHVRWRFSLRTLLIATTLVAVVLGLAVYAAGK
jgi:hypothetical protein